MERKGKGRRKVKQRGRGRRGKKIIKAKKGNRGRKDMGKRSEGNEDFP